MNPYQKRVRDFMAAIGQATPDEPTLEGYPFGLRINLIQEEFYEFATACGWREYDGSISDGSPCWKRIGKPDMVGMIDAITDLLVVTFGAAVSMGVDIDPFWAEVMRANDSKLDADGKVIRRESDGKVLKGPNYSPPDLASVLEHVRSGAERCRILAEAVADPSGLDHLFDSTVPIGAEYVRRTIGEGDLTAKRAEFTYSLLHAPRRLALLEIEQMLVDAMDVLQQSDEEAPVIAAYNEFRRVAETLEKEETP